MPVTVETLMRKYRRAKHELETAKVGPRTALADAQIQRLVEIADEHGILEDFIREAAT